MWTVVTLTVFLGTAGGAPDASVVASSIDAELGARFAAESIVPAPRADDAEFLRRVSLDLIGRIPSVDELDAFLADADPDKRAVLITQYLDDPQHADH